MNTLGGNTLGLLREVCNFVLLRIHGCVVQRSLNENMIFVLYCFRKSFQWTPPLVRLLACLLSRLFACFRAMLVMSITLICFMPFHILFAYFPSIACLLVSCLCLCMYTHGARTHGARARFPKRKKKRAQMQACR